MRVHCTAATDASGNTTRGSFVLQVRGAFVAVRGSGPPGPNAKHGKKERGRTVETKTARFGHTRRSSVVRVLDLLLPRRCVVCRAPGAQLCARCRDALPALLPPLCELCGAPTAWPVARCRECSGRGIAFVRARGAVAYEDEVQRLVRAWKERGLRALAEDAADVVVARLPRPAANVVTFVPGDAWRSRERGHRPAERLARALAERWELPCEPLLRRSGHARRQRGLDRAARRRNPGFAAVAQPAAVVLVDDVYTTGATAHAAAAALGGRVEVVTFARAVRRA